ncbi:uncharacterized protein LOC113863234 isoform X2 [Abrus precatorius]|uniref:Uncharacterized protein LOC113863234 isoform X2 n=1 Tax=Abrus precatorius TaxID=3816 RepID=A0A8B8LCS5_ABRPR|nr:uncharacterized protein LOC113863234 isoform X2 [Abrus precatorius]
MHYHAQTQTVFALLLLFRPRNVSATGSKEFNVRIDYYDQGIVYYINSCNNFGEGNTSVVWIYPFYLLQTSYSQGQSELPKPLLSDEANRIQQVQPLSFISKISLWKACSTILFFLGLAALISFVVLLCAAIYHSTN